MRGSSTCHAAGALPVDPRGSRRRLRLHQMNPSDAHSRQWASILPTARRLQRTRSWCRGFKKSPARARQRAAHLSLSTVPGHHGGPVRRRAGPDSERTRAHAAASRWRSRPTRGRSTAPATSPPVVGLVCVMVDKDVVTISPQVGLAANEVPDVVQGRTPRRAHLARCDLAPYRSQLAGGVTVCTSTVTATPGS